MDLTCVLTLIGLVVVLRHVLELVVYLWKRNRSLEPYKYGWAVVTGATDGIGKALAEELIRTGFRVVLISRSLPKLETVRNELISKYSAQGKIELIQADFTEGIRAPTEFYGRLEKELEKFEVSILVNNVGIMHWKTFETTSFGEIEETLAVNILPQTYLTRVVLPTMTSRYAASKRRSLVIDLSSNASIIPLPFLAVYGATKTYNNYLTQALKNERPPGVTFLSVLPGWVATSMPTKNSVAPDPSMVNVTTMARAVLSNHAQGSTAGHPKHQVMGWIMKYLLDNPFGRAIINVTIRMMEKKRKKAT